MAASERVWNVLYSFAPLYVEIESERKGEVIDGKN